MRERKREKKELKKKTLNNSEELVIYVLDEVFKNEYMSFKRHLNSIVDLIAQDAKERPIRIAFYNTKNPQIVCGLVEVPKEALKAYEVGLLEGSRVEKEEDQPLYVVSWQKQTKLMDSLGEEIPVPRKLDIKKQCLLKEWSMKKPEGISAEVDLT